VGILARLPDYWAEVFSFFCAFFAHFDGELTIRADLASRMTDAALPGDPPKAASQKSQPQKSQPQKAPASPLPLHFSAISKTLFTWTHEPSSLG
jgi:hypothetical protein